MPFPPRCPSSRWLFRAFPVHYISLTPICPLFPTGFDRIAALYNPRSGEHPREEVIFMAKQGMARPDWTKRPRNSAPPVPEIQGKAKTTKTPARPIIAGTSGPQAEGLPRRPPQRATHLSRPRHHRHRPGPGQPGKRHPRSRPGRSLAQAPHRTPAAPFPVHHDGAGATQPPRLRHRIFYGYKKPVQGRNMHVPVLGG